MAAFKSPVPLWMGFPLLFILGVGTGIVAAGYERSQRNTLEVPAEIVVAPPPPGVIACFPNMSFFGAVDFQEQLEPSWVPDSCLLQGLVQHWNQQDHQTRLTLVHSTREQYTVLASSAPHHLTLLTEQGSFDVFPIRKRLHPKYESLMQLRHTL